MRRIRGDRRGRRSLLPGAGICLLAGALWPAADASAQQQSQLPVNLGNYPGTEGFELAYESIRIEGSTFFLRGDVDLVDAEHGIRLLADELSFNAAELSFEASGSVSFEQGELLLNGSAMRGDLDDGTLQMEDVIGVAPGPFYVRARRVEQIEPGKFRVEGGIVTPCNQTNPIWEFRSGSMTFRPGKYVSMSWPHIRVKGVPIFGLPYVYWPLQETQRQTGLLLPGVGQSNRKGFMLSQSLFWAVNRSLDVTATYEHFSKAGSGFGGEIRHALGDSANGFVRAYYLPGRLVTPEEAAAGAVDFPSGFSFNGEHFQALPGGFALRAQADFVSSTEFARGFRDDVDLFLQRQSTISGEINKSWGSSTLSLLGEHRERFTSGTGSTIGRRLPQVKYTLRSTQLTGPLYFALQASAARFQRFEVQDRRAGVRVDGGSYGRLDAFPDLSVQLTQIPWLTFNPFFRWRATYWTHSEGRRDFRFRDESVLRNLYETGVEMVGPAVVKIFDTPGSEYSPAYKHLIQPRLVYRRVRQINTELPRIIQFDEVDTAVSDRQELIAEVTTRLFAKRYLNPQDPQRQVWQVAEITVGRSFNLEPLSELLEAAGAPRVNLPYFVRTTIQPSQRLYLRGDVTFTPGFKPAGVSMSANVNHTKGNAGLTWSRGATASLDPLDLTRVLVETSSHSVRANAQADLLGRSLTLGSAVDMDLVQNKLQNLSGTVRWNLQCCSIGLDVRRLNFADRQEVQFAFLLELAQVGQVGFDNQRR